MAVFDVKLFIFEVLFGRRQTPQSGIDDLT